MLAGSQQTGGGRYGGGVSSDEFSLAAMSVEIKNQRHEISEINRKLNTVLDSIGKDVVYIKTQMAHLVTKEDCADKSSKMADDLKKRMDGDREITGMNLRVPDILNSKLMNLGSPTPVPRRTKERDTPKNGVSAANQLYKTPAEAVRFWIPIISALITISLFLGGLAIFVNKTIERSDRQESMMQQILSDRNERQHDIIRSGPSVGKAAPDEPIHDIDPAMVE
jgi:hypothetical protein